MKRYLVIRPGAIGDAIVALPVVQRLQACFPGAYTELVVGGPAARLLAGRCEASAVSSFDEARWAALFSPDMPAEVRSFLRTFSAIILYLAVPGVDLQQRLTAALGIRVILWPPLPPPETRLPISLHLQGALTPLGISLRMEWPRLALTAEDCAFAEGYWRSHGLPADRRQPVVAIHPGSGSAKKNWPAARYVELANRLQREYQARILVVAGPADEAARRELLAHWSGEPPLVTGSLTLPQVASLLARCRCLVGNDSGIAHLAAALGAPTVAIFGPSDPLVWVPAGPVATVIAPQVSCAPCPPEQRRFCPRLACLESIGVEEVYAQARHISISPGI